MRLCRSPLSLPAALPLLPRRSRSSGGAPCPPCAARGLSGGRRASREERRRWGRPRPAASPALGADRAGEAPPATGPSGPRPSAAARHPPAVAAGRHRGVGAAPDSLRPPPALAARPARGELAAEGGAGPRGRGWGWLTPGAVPLGLAGAFLGAGRYLLRGGARPRTAALLLAACCGGEAVARTALAAGEDRRRSLAAAGVVLSCLAAATWLVLRLRQGVLMLAVTSAARTTSLVALERVPASWRPYLAYLLGLLGVLLAGYAERLWPPRRAAPLAEPPAAPPAADEAPALRRRRRSSSMISAEMSGGGGGKSHRRTSLPCIPREQVRRGERRWGGRRGAERGCCPEGTGARRREPRDGAAGGPRPLCPGRRGRNSEPFSSHSPERGLLLGRAAES